MIEVESTPATSKRRNIVFWPSFVMLVMVFGFWVFLYDDYAALLFWLVIALVRGHLSHLFRMPDRPSETEEILSFLIPIVLAASMGWWFIPCRQ